MRRLSVLLLLVAAACSADPCAAPGACEEVCFDGVDNDRNGLSDCEDSACSSVCRENCFNNRDDDADGQVDCSDDECACGEVCGNGIDDDSSGQTDCEDPACAAECDEDGDGYISEVMGGNDCNDQNDEVHPAAVELCNTGIDEDCDHLVDECSPEPQGGGTTGGSPEPSTGTTTGTTPSYPSWWQTGGSGGYTPSGGSGAGGSGTTGGSGSGGSGGGGGYGGC